MVIIDLRGISDAADYFVICTGTSEPHVRALAGDVVATLREAGHKPWHVEGTESLRWVLVDLVDIVIHIFGKEARGFYALERLWGDGAMTRFDNSWTHEGDSGADVGDSGADVGDSDADELSFAPLTKSLFDDG